MKILLISNMYPNDRYPSYGIFVKNTEEILKNNNINVDKIVMNKRNNKFLKIINYATHYMKIIIYSFKKYDYLYVHYVAHNSIPVLVASKINKNLKVVTNVHGSDVMPISKTQKSFQKYVKKLLQISEKVITPSNYYKSYIEDEYSIYSKKIKVFPSGGVNREIFTFNNKKDNRYYIGYIGRIEGKKGWQTYLEFVKKAKNQNEFKDYKFVVVGSGKDNDKFKEILKKLDIEDIVEKHDLLPQEKLKSIYDNMAILCFPSKLESLGLVGIEAMSCGVPVIGSNIDGLKEYIENGKNGYLFETGNSEEMLAKARKYITSSEKKKNEFIDNALKTGKRYDSKKVEKIIIDIFK